VRDLVRREVDVAVPADVLWDYLMDWPRQGEWIPFTRVERADPADPANAVGGRIRAWSGIGPVGFWDEMTITTWDRRADGGGVCEVLKTGAVVKGEGVFEVVALGAHRSRFVVSELTVIPLGRVGALGWRLVRPLLVRMLDRALARMKQRIETAHRTG
jgi:polyketide cyclase/dehydrase/lipid transport protein